MKTSGIRINDSKGRHTTTYRKMIELPNGARLIDTPGMRELGMCDATEGIDETFEDIVELEANCKYSDCKHITEPGCAIKEALENGALEEERYQLYLKLRLENRRSSVMKVGSKQRKPIGQQRKR